MTASAWSSVRSSGQTTGAGDSADTVGRKPAVGEGAGEDGGLSRPQPKATRAMRIPKQARGSRRRAASTLPLWAGRGPKVQVVVVHVGRQGPFPDVLVIVPHLEEHTDVLEVLRHGAPELLEVLSQVSLQGAPLPDGGIVPAQEHD